MAEGDRTHDEEADAGLGSRSGARIEGATNTEGGGAEASGTEVSGSGDPASIGEGGESRGVGEGGGEGDNEGARRTGDWNPGQVSGGGELY
jgi:hypothetical protein